VLVQEATDFAGFDPVILPSFHDLWCHQGGPEDVPKEHVGSSWASPVPRKCGEGIGPRGMNRYFWVEPSSDSVLVV